MYSKSLMGLTAAMVALLLSPAALADDWVATKLRGAVLTLVDGEWEKLHRGDMVSDDRVIRTLRGGRVSFQRGAETIELGGDTQVQILDRTGQKFTTVKQYFGTVSVEAEVQAVQHFSVQTPHLAAVVKGTRFVVRSDKTRAQVEVRRGRVAVEDRDTHQSTLVSAGQSAGTSDGAPLEVRGRGKLPDVLDARGKAVVATTNSPDRKAAEHDAALAARDAALAAGASPKAAERAAKEAAKEVKDAAKEARSEGKGGGNSDSGNSGSGNGNSTGGGGNSDSGSGNGGSDNSGNSGNSGSGGNSGGGSGKDKKDKD